MLIRDLKARYEKPRKAGKWKTANEKRITLSYSGQKNNFTQFSVFIVEPIHSSAFKKRKKKKKKVQGLPCW